MADPLIEAVLDVLAPPIGDRTLSTMRSASTKDWQRALHWMDTTGVALYFLREVERNGLRTWVPSDVLDRLRWRQTENGERTTDLLREIAELKADFERTGTRFLVLKGLANIPEACPDPSLRLQIDLDLLIEESSLTATRELLRRRGYGLTAIGRGTWEFRSVCADLPSLRDLYSVKRQRSIDVHPASKEDFDTLYERRSERQVAGVGFEALGALDRLLAQAAHLAKHVRSEWTRVSWIHEMRCALEHASKQPELWERLAARLQEDRAAAEDLGTAILVCRTVFPEMCSDAVLRSAERSVPPRLRLWIAEFGREAVLTSFPGSKLYLLLPASPALGPARTSQRARLLPMTVPARVVPSATSWRYRIRAARSQWSFILVRLRFHLSAGLRYLSAAPRWRRLSHQLEERG